MNFDIPSHIINAISWTVIHSIWQVSLIALVMSVLLHNTSTKNAIKRYKIGLLSLAAIAITSGITFMIYAYSPEVILNDGGTIIMLSNTSVAESSGTFGWIDTIYSYLNQNVALITQLWIIGVIAFGVKFLMGYSYIQYLNFGPSLKYNQQLENTLQSLMYKMDIAGSVLIAETHKVISPIVTGYIKPIILFPLEMTTQLSQKEIELVIAHELAHIMRNDWIVNILQSLFEIVFYYHPGVWWISAHIRNERENCCDDIAIMHGYDHLSYAKVLVKLKEFQLQHVPTLAMSFFNTKNSLMNRIKRLLGQPQNRNIMKEKIVAIALIFTVAIAFAGTKISNEILHIPYLENEKTYLVENGDITFITPENLFYIQDTIPHKKGRSTFTLKNSDGKSYHIESENGKIQKLEIDGEVIPPDQYDEYIDEISGDENWKFNFNEDGSFGAFNFDQLHDYNFNFDFDKDIETDWTLKMEELSERLKDLDFEEMEWDKWADEMKLHKLDMDSLMGNIWIGKGEHMDGIKEMLKQLQEMEIGEQEHFKGLERLHELEGMEKLRGLEGLERLKEFEGMEDMIRGFEFEFPEMEFERHRIGGTVSDKLARELNEDRLIKIGENNEIELSGKHLKINGDKQPDNIWEKYKTIFEEYTGMKLTKDSKVKFDIIGKESRSGIRRI